MGSNILGIGQSALAAAQIGISTTGHNIANAATPGYNRQTVTQEASLAQNFGFGYIGQGTQVTGIQRMYSDFLSNQVTSAQTSKGEIDSYLSQVSQIDNLLSDASAGLSPAIQSYFTGLQQVNSAPNDPAARQTAMSSAQITVERFQSLSGQLTQIGDGVNAQIASSVSAINSYAGQIAKLNDLIGRETSGSGAQPNDLLDQRDNLISELNKQVKTTVVKQDAGNYSVYIGNGQPLVVGTKATTLQPTGNPEDLSRLEVGFVNGGKTTMLAESGITGGTLGGLFSFRKNTLVPAQNQLGQIATSFAYAMNKQNSLGQDQSGNPGTALFAIGAPVTTPNANNKSTSQINTAVVDGSAITASNYKVAYDGTNYTITRLSDGFSSSAPTLPHTVDGLNFSLQTAAPAAGDTFFVQPTVKGAEQLKLLQTSTSQLAVALPIRTAANIDNVGTATIGADSVDATYAGAPLGGPVQFQYDAVTAKGFTVTPPQKVSVSVNGVSTTYPSGTPVPYTDGAKISIGGASFVISGKVLQDNTFTVGPNLNGSGDNRNGLAMAQLQLSTTTTSLKASFQGVFAQLVSTVGNKTSELRVTSQAEGSALASAVSAQQSESGVNLDEEAANLLRYQQAYQAAGKLMQTTSSLFDILLNLGK